MDIYNLYTLYLQLISELEYILEDTPAEKLLESQVAQYKQVRFCLLVSFIGGGHM